MSEHTRGQLEVQIASTCSGAWPVVVERCQDPATKETWFREIAETPTAFIEKNSKARDQGKYGNYNEAPGRFKLYTDSAESIANAHLFAAAHELLEVAQEMYALMQQGKVTLTHGAQGGIWTLPDKFGAAIAKATTITDMRGGD